MRDIDRIDKIISCVEQVMLEENMFFMEVLESVVGRNDDPYYIEDETILNGLVGKYDYVNLNKNVESKLMTEISLFWKDKPDYRLFQLICNLIESDRDGIDLEYETNPFDLSDPDIIKLLRRNYK
jgi:hypothetical protein